MNAHSDMLRQGISQIQPMLGVNPPHFMQQQPQQHHGQPSQGQPSPAALLQNGQNANTGMGLPNANQANYSINLVQSNNVNRHQFIGNPSQQGLNPVRGAGPPLVNGLGHNHLQVPFTNGIQPIRRVPSQPSALNHNQGPGGGHMGGFSQGMPVGGMGGMGGMGMNAGQSMPGPIRQVHHPSHPLNGMRQQHPQHLMQQMPPDMSMGLNRQQHLGVGVDSALPPHANRTPSAQAQVMGNSSQPTSLAPSHPGGMQPPMHHHNAFPNPISLPHHNQQPPLGSSPHVGTHPQTHTPANLGPNMPPSNHPPLQQDNTMFMPYQNQSLPSQVPRLTQNNHQFPFAHSSTPPMQDGELGQNPGGAQMNVPGSSSRPGLMSTPAQVFERMSTANEDFGNYGLSQPQQGVPARPPSHNASHAPFPPPQNMPPRQSPRAPDPMGEHMGQTQRPQSQQGQQRQSPQQAGASRTPRVPQQRLPVVMNPRISGAGPGPLAGPPQQGPPPPQPQTASGHPIQIAPRQPQPPGPPPPASSASNASRPVPAPNQPDGPPPPQHSAHSQHPPHPQHPPHADLPPQLSAPMPPRPIQPIFMIGLGQAITRLLQLSGTLQLDARDKPLAHWESVVDDYFAKGATMKFTLWKDSQKQEAKPFEIGTPILPRFFLVTTQSGVKSMSIGLDGAREKVSSTPWPIRGSVECAHAIWTFRYTTGYTVTLNGPLTAHLVAVPQPSPVGGPPSAGYALRIESLAFDATSHDKLIHVDSIVGMPAEESQAQTSLTQMGNPTRRDDDDRRHDDGRTIIGRASLPSEPINAFGVPQATMRCLELAESVSQMSELIEFSNVKKLGPMDALAQLAQQIRQQQQKLSGGVQGKEKGPGSSVLDGMNAQTSPGSLYQNASTSLSIAQTPTPSTPQNPPPAADGSTKQGKVPAPSSSQASGSTPSASASTPAAAATPGGSNTTPHMANATLKRKAPHRTEDGSPIVANAEQGPGKRTTRKRGRTQGG